MSTPLVKHLIEEVLSHMSCAELMKLAIDKAETVADVKSIEDVMDVMMRLKQDAMTRLVQKNEQMVREHRHPLCVYSSDGSESASLSKDHMYIIAFTSHDQTHDVGTMCTRRGYMIQYDEIIYRLHNEGHITRVWDGGPFPRPYTLYQVQ